MSNEEMKKPVYVPCSSSCLGHVTHPYERCGIMWSKDRPQVPVPVPKVSGGDKEFIATILAKYSMAGQRVGWLSLSSDLNKWHKEQLSAQEERLKGEFIDKINAMTELDHEYGDIEGYLISKNQLIKSIKVK